MRWGPLCYIARARLEKQFLGRIQTMKQIALFCVSAIALGFVLTGCPDEGAQTGIVVEEVQGYKPNLPPVPSIPKPSVAESHSDGTLSVYGLRKGIEKLVDTQVSVTAYIVEVYTKPECPEGKTCHTLMPHLFLADEKGETLPKRRLRLVGYAQSFKEMEEQQEIDETGREKELPEGVFLPPVVWDWRVGHKYKLTGQFGRQSGAGFMDTNGLMEYGSHECLDCPVEEEEEAK